MYNIEIERLVDAFGVELVDLQSSASVSVVSYYLMIVKLPEQLHCITNEIPITSE